MSSRPCTASRAAALALTLAACAARPVVPGASAPPPPSPAAQRTPDLASLHEDDRLSGFMARALYVDAAGHPRGARFVHEKTGFVFDYLVIESAPQAMIYAWTYPPTESGEPHTQEHLLLGKGNAGRWLGNVLHSNFTESGAFTADRRTAYHFSTWAGPEAFWNVLQTHLQALLHPDYSDEEIRREVRNFGVSKQPDGALALDEKGTVYNEMVRTTESSNDRTWYAMLRLLYGEDHPLSHEQGGTPEGIRELTPERIRAFHAAHYQLGNMGAVMAFPSSLSLGTVLAHVGGMLDGLATPGAPTQPIVTEATLPSTHPAPAGTTRVVEYPFASADNPGRAMLAWPADRHLDLDERTVLEIFMSAFAEGHSSSLYRAIVDSKTRGIDLGATDVWAWTRNGFGQPTYVGVESVSAAHADDASMNALRTLVHAELDKIAALPDGSKELAAFNERVEARVAERRRATDKFLDTPPQFGVRGTEDRWAEHLDDLTRVHGFVRDLSFDRPIAHALELARSPKNEWRDRIRAWGLLEAPYVVVGRPSPELRARLDRERDARIAAELARLEAQHGTHDAQEAMKQREAEITAASDAIARAEKEVPLAPLAPDPPMTADDSLKWTSDARGGVARVASMFEAMKSATVGLNLRLDDVPDESLPWLGVLPALVSQVGVLRDGMPIPYDEVEDRLRNEVLGVEVRFSSSPYSGRTELAVEASGNDVDETRRALGWARDFLATPDWRPENLPRIRDVVEQELTRLHDTMTGPEEYWIEDVEEAYRRQDRPVLAHTRSFLTRTHDAFLVSWRLEGGPDASGVAPFLESLAAAAKKLDRPSLAKLAEALASEGAAGKDDGSAGAKNEKSAKTAADVERWVRAGRALPKPAQSRVRKAGRDLGRLLVDLPDESLASDWAALCREMASGVARPPGEALAALNKTLATARHEGNARVWMVGSSAHQAALADDVEKTLDSLDPSPVARISRAPRRLVLDRAHARGLTGDSPLIALVNPSTANGSLVHTAPAIDLDEQRDDALVAYLAANVFDGAGTQSFYKRIWGAALAYSGYVWSGPTVARMELYADRCPDLPQLLRFVDAEVRRAPADPRYVDYSIVPAFGSRVADTFEDRARGMAVDLLEGRTPDRVRAFRGRLLALRSRPGVADAMRAHYVDAMGAVIPSLAAPGSLARGAVYFVTGPEAAIAAYEKEIARTRGPGTKVLRLWARDFWDLGGVDAGSRGAVPASHQASSRR